MREQEERKKRDEELARQEREREYQAFVAGKAQTGAPEGPSAPQHTRFRKENSFMDEEKKREMAAKEAERQRF